MIVRGEAVSRQDEAVTVEVQMGDRAGRAVVTVYDARGRLVQELLDEELAAHAVEELSWNGRDRDGHHAAPGVYRVTFVTSGDRVNRKIQRFR